MWIVDFSGPKDDVIAAIKARTYDVVVKEVEDALAEAKTLAKRLGDTPSGPTFVAAVESRTLQLEALKMDGERECFERCRAFLIAEVEAMKTERVGATARIKEHPDSNKGPGDAEVSISVSGFDG